MQLTRSASAVAEELPEHFTTMREVGPKTLDGILSLARALRQAPRPVVAAMGAHRVVATLFYQPSTRTRLSFQSAALRLGALCTGFEAVGSTRSGGYYNESLEDMVANVAQYADVLVLRHASAGTSSCAAHAVSQALRWLDADTGCAVVNAGDHEHPTQTLADLLTLTDEFGTLEGRTIGLLGRLDVRVLRSLVFALSRQPNLRLNWLPEEGHGMPADVGDWLRARGTPVELVDDAHELLMKSDAVVTIGVAHPDTTSTAERPVTPARFRITNQMLDGLTHSVPVLHCGPVGDELEHVSGHPFLRHLHVARNGLWVRAALLAALFAKTPLA